MENKRILCGICGSFCNHRAVLEQLEPLCKRNDVYFVVSENVYSCNTRFFKAQDFIERLQALSSHEIVHTIEKAELFGPQNQVDMMVIAPMSATVAARMAHGIYDHPVALAAKAVIRNQKNVVFGIATNDGLGMSGSNIFTLLNYKHFYVIPFRQDAPFVKARSIVSDWTMLEETCDKALLNQQLQPILLGGK